MDSPHHQMASPSQPKLLSMPDMLAPNAYVWMIFFSTLDVILTALLLAFGGDGEGGSVEEINPIAALIIEHWEMAGAMAFKFALILLAIVLCEMVGRRSRTAGRRLAWTCLVIAAFPVVWTFALVLTERVTFFF